MTIWDTQRTRSRERLDEYTFLGLPTRIATMLTRAGLDARAVRGMTDDDLLRVRQLGPTALAVIRAALPSDATPVVAGPRNTDALLPVDWARLADAAEVAGYGDRRQSELLGLVASGQLAWPAGMAARKHDALACVARREVA
jgi:hypothetical protein